MRSPNHLGGNAIGNLTKIVIALAVLYGGLRLAGVNPFGSGEPSVEDLQAKASDLGREKIVILMTGTDWCPYCMELEKGVINTEEWKDFSNEEVVFQSYDFGAFERPKSGVKGDLLRRFEIEGFPTMVVLDQSGKLLGDESGYAEGGVAHYTGWIRSL